MMMTVSLSNLKFTLQRSSIVFRRDRVVTALAPGIAPEYAPSPERDPAKHAVTADGFGGVLGAGGSKSAAGGKQGRDPASVEQDGEDHEFPDGMPASGVFGGIRGAVFCFWGQYQTLPCQSYNFHNHTVSVPPQ